MEAEKQTDELYCEINKLISQSDQFESITACYKNLYSLDKEALISNIQSAWNDEEDLDLEKQAELNVSSDLGIHKLEADTLEEMRNKCNQALLSSGGGGFCPTGFWRLAVTLWMGLGV